MDAQKGFGLSCAVLSLLSETSPLIGRHSAVQPKGMGLCDPRLHCHLFVQAAPQQAPGCGRQPQFCEYPTHLDRILEFE